MLGYRAPENVHNLISLMPFSSPNPMFENLLELSHWDNSYKWLSTEFSVEITQVVSIEDKTV